MAILSTSFISPNSVASVSGTKLNTLAALFFCALYSSSVLGFQSSYGLEVGAEKDDSVALNNANPIDSSVTRYAIDFDVAQRGPVFSMLASGAHTVRQFSGGNLEDTNLTNGSARLGWKILPRRFDWVANATASTYNINPTLFGVPDNQGQNTALSTGPDLQFKLNGSTNLRYSGRIQKENRRDQVDLNNKTSSHTLNFSRQIFQTLSGQLSASSSSLDSDSDSIDNDSTRLSLGLTKQFATSVLELYVGTTDVKFDSGFESSGQEQSASYNYDLSSQSSVYLDYSKSISNSGRDLSSLVQNQSSGNQLDTLLQTSVSTDTRKSAGFKSKINDVSININYFILDSEPLSALALNNTTVASTGLGSFESSGYGLKLSKPFGANTVSLSGAASEFESDTASSDSTRVRLGLDRVIRKSLRVGIFYRTLNTSNNSGLEADSNLYGVYLRAGL